MPAAESFRNIAFTKLIKLGGRHYEFNFRRAPGSVSSYETDVTDAQGRRIMFMMSHNAGRWETHGALLPAWIEQQSDVIGEMIASEITE